MLNPRNRIHRVKEGDSLARVAQTYYGDASLWPHIARANRIPRNGEILIGMRLRLPPIPTQGRIPQHGGAFVNMIPAYLNGDPGPPAAKYLRFPWITYSFEHGFDLLPNAGGANLTVTLSGSVTLHKEGFAPPAVVEFAVDTNGQATLDVKEEYKGQFASVTGGMSLKFGDGKVSLEGGFALSQQIGPVTIHTTPFGFDAELDPPVAINGQFKDKYGKWWQYEGALGFDVKYEKQWPTRGDPDPTAAPIPEVVHLSVEKSGGGGLLGKILDVVVGLIAGGAIIVIIAYFPPAAIGLAPATAFAVTAAVERGRFADAARLYNWPQQRG